MVGVNLWPRSGLGDRVTVEVSPSDFRTGVVIGMSDYGVAIKFDRDPQSLLVIWPYDLVRPIPKLAM